MCCWVYKPKGVEMIDREEMVNIVNTNPDGIGIAYTNNGELHYAKGFMTFTEFEKFYNKLAKVIDIKNEALLFHARITTTKSVKPFQCHPFIITDNEKELYNLHGTSDLIFVHNGSMQNFYSFNKKLSDTQNFNLYILSKMKALDKEFYKKDFYLNWIADLTQKSNDMYNRFCIMDKDGYASFVGDVIKKENGIVYANENHKFDIISYLDGYYKKVKVKLCKLSAILPPKNLRFATYQNNEILDIIQNVSGVTYWIDKNCNIYIEDNDFLPNKQIIMNTEQTLICVDDDMQIYGVDLRKINIFKEKDIYISNY